QDAQAVVLRLVGPRRAVGRPVHEGGQHGRRRPGQWCGGQPLAQRSEGVQGSAAGGGGGRHAGYLPLGPGCKVASRVPLSAVGTPAAAPGARRPLPTYLLPSTSRIMGGSFGRRGRVRPQNRTRPAAFLREETFPCRPATPTTPPL